MSAIGISKDCSISRQLETAGIQLREAHNKSLFLVARSSCLRRSAPIVDPALDSADRGRTIVRNPIELANLVSEATERKPAKEDQ